MKLVTLPSPHDLLLVFRACGILVPIQGSFVRDDLVLLSKHHHEWILEHGGIVLEGVDCRHEACKPIDVE